MAETVAREYEQHILRISIHTSYLLLGWNQNHLSDILDKLKCGFCSSPVTEKPLPYFIYS